MLRYVPLQVRALLMRRPLSLLLACPLTLPAQAQTLNLSGGKLTLRHLDADAGIALRSGRADPRHVSHAVSSGFIGTSWNGVTWNIPAPTGGTISMCGHKVSSTVGTVDLTPCGIANTNITVSNATIIDPYGDTIVTVTGNNNTIWAQSRSGTLQGAIAHNNAVVIGTGNVVNSVSAQSTGVWFYGTGNTDYEGTGGSAESQTGNTFITAYSSKAQTALVWRWIGPNGNQGVTPWPTSGRADTFNFSSILHTYPPLARPPLASCVLPSPTGNSPSTCAGTDALYEAAGSFRHNRGAPGGHTYTVKGQPGYAGNPYSAWIDCTTGQSETLAQFLGNPNVITGGTPPTPPGPTTISGPSPSWPCTDDVQSCPLGPNSIRFPGIISIAGVPTLVSTANDGYSGGWKAWGAGWANILDEWSLSQIALHGRGAATTTVTYSVVNGHIGVNGPASKTWGPVPPAEAHEIVVSSSYQPKNRTVTSDRLTITVSNSGGDSYTTSFPIKVIQGAICP